MTSDPVRHARARAVLEAEPSLVIGAPTNAWMDAAFRAMGEFADPSFPSSVRQPMLRIACGDGPTAARALKIEAVPHGARAHHRCRR